MEKAHKASQSDYIERTTNSAHLHTQEMGGIERGGSRELENRQIKTDKDRNKIRNR